ncbi:MAG: ATP-binding protein [Muribaculaceae bacterium]|nr:ATP-binding protein [Muribaculaceae bacterium]
MAKTTIFRRKIYDKMLEWKRQARGSSALLIKGARRIGKSTIAEEFARKEYKSYIIIDFADVKPEILELFDNTADIDFFFLRLQALTGVDLHKRKSVIIFDEVQLCPKARQAIKYFVKDGRYDYIETGSLLSIKKNVEGILIPSEEEQIEMFPMDFEEFLWAVGKGKEYELIRYLYENKKAAGDSTHRSLMKDFRLYILVGGMPQAVAAYLADQNFTYIDKIKRNILQLYIDDFRKIDPYGRASTIFTSIPAELSRNTSQYRVGNVIENGRPSRLGEVFADIADSLTVNYAYHANDPGVGFALHANYDIFKIYLADTGLFVTLSFMDKEITENTIYQKLLLDKLPTDLGFIYENVVAQMLRSAGHKLYYYTFRDKNEESKSVRSYEIDFLISRDSKICPIEVKSSGYATHKSIDMFRNKYSSRIKERYLLYTKDLRKEGDLFCLPVYMAALL